MKRHLQCAEEAKSASNLTKYCACHEICKFKISAETPWLSSANRKTTNPAMKSSSRTRRLGDLPRPTLETQFVLKSTTFRALAIYQNFIKCCACREKWHSSLIKCCACHEKWHSNFSKYCACHAKNESLGILYIYIYIDTSSSRASREKKDLYSKERVWPFLCGERACFDARHAVRCHVMCPAMVTLCVRSGSVLQSTTPVLQSANPVLPCTTKYYTLYCKSANPVLLCTTKFYSSTALYYKVLLQYYPVLQSTTPVLLRTAKY